MVRSRFVQMLNCCGCRESDACNSRGRAEIEKGLPAAATSDKKAVVGERRGEAICNALDTSNHNKNRYQFQTRIPPFTFKL